jgi:hypothetical protein
MRNFWYVRIFEPVIRALAVRGHSIHILAEHDPNPVPQWTAAAMALAGECPNVTIGYARRSINDEWLDLRVMVRLGRDYLRFLRPQYASTPILAERARARVPAAIVGLAERGAMMRTTVDGVLRTAERAIPEDPEIAAAVAAERPDVVLVTPLLDLGSDQHDVVRTARRLGVPTALCVGSWDHLSSKALIREAPDRVFVWNATQKREAIDLHHVPRDRVVVTGAQCFDQWFGRQPALPRVEFCRKVSLDPSKPYILYVCSALFEGSPNEAEFIATWIAAVRASHDPARAAGILIRPHPKRGFEWDAVDVAAFPGVSLWPPRAAAPMDMVTQSDYFDSMYHSAAVVGLNTSALIEAGIVGRAVHTILMPEFNENQEGTLHFHYLIDGGLLRVARDMNAHVAQLAESIRSPRADEHPNRSFIESFVRPQGLTVAATPLFVDAIEQLAALNPARSRVPLWASTLRAVMTPLARRTLGTFAEHESRERRYRDKQQARDERTAALEAQRAAEKARIVEGRRLQHEAARRERQARAERNLAGRQATKKREREDKEQLKAARMAQWQREKRRHAFNARLIGYCRRLVKPFSTSR